MAYAYIAGTDSSLGANGGTSAAISTAGASLVVFAISSDSGGGPPNTGHISDTQSLTWTLRDTMDNGISAVQIFDAVPTSTGGGATIAVTVTKTACYAAIAMATFSGAHASPFESVEGDFSTGVTTVSPNPVVTPSAATMVVSVLAGGSAFGTVTGPTGYSTPLEQDFVGATSYGVALAYKIGLGATEDPEWTASSAPNMSTLAAAYIPSAGGGGNRRRRLIICG
jgi:hypothetical protein